MGADQTTIRIPNWLWGIVSAVLIAALIGGAGWLTNLAAAQHALDNRLTAVEQAGRDTRSRLERIEDKLDALLGR